MTEKIATVVGATGLIGSELVSRLLADPTYNKVRVIVRRPYPMQHAKLEAKIIDFTDHQAMHHALSGSHTVFCVVGTTRKKVKGDLAAYEKVDLHIPALVAACCEETKVRRLLLVSSVGADSHSRQFYLKLKGMAEEAVCKRNIPVIAIFRPSMLLGKRSEFRLGESIGQVVMKIFQPLIPARYKAIAATDVAEAMVCAAKDSTLHGIYLLHYQDMQAFINRVKQPTNH